MQITPPLGATPPLAVGIPNMPPAKFTATYYHDMGFGIIWILQFIITLALASYQLYLGDINVEEIIPTPAGVWGWLALMFGMPCVGGLLLIAGMHCFPAGFVLGCNLLIVAGLVAVAFVTLLSSLASFICILIVAALYSFWIWTVRSRIPLAVLLLRCSTTIVASHPAVLWVPLWQNLCFVIYIFFFVLLLVFSQRHRWTWIFCWMAFFWTEEVFANVVFTTACGVAAMWYFLPSGTQGVVRDSFSRASLNSFGSICFGSLLVAVVKVIRFLVHGVRSQNSGNCCLMFIRCCVECFLGCLEAMLIFFNEYAFAHVAIYGTGFRESARATVVLLRTRGLFALINDNLLSPVLGISALIVGAGTGLAVGYGSRSPVLGVVGGIAGFIVCSNFTNVVHGCVVSLFVCFAENPDALRNSHPELHQGLWAAMAGVQLPQPTPIEVPQTPPAAVMPYPQYPPSCDAGPHFSAPFMGPGPFVGQPVPGAPPPFPNRPPPINPYIAPNY